MARYPLNRYVPGTYKRECDRCGFDYLRNQMRKEPVTNLIVCQKCYDPEHPRHKREPIKPERPFRRD